MRSLCHLPFVKNLDVGCTDEMINGKWKMEIASGGSV